MPANLTGNWPAYRGGSSWPGTGSWSKQLNARLAQALVLYTLQPSAILFGFICAYYVLSQFTSRGSNPSVEVFEDGTSKELRLNELIREGL